MTRLIRESSRIILLKDREILESISEDIAVTNFFVEAGNLEAC
jgi:hypothetical protein